MHRDKVEEEREMRSAKILIAIVGVVLAVPTASAVAESRMGGWQESVTITGIGLGILHGPRCHMTRRISSSALVGLSLTGLGMARLSLKLRRGIKPQDANLVKNFFL